MTGRPRMRGERRAPGGSDPLDRVVRRSRFAMALESFTRAFWPLGSALAALWAALAFGLAEIATRGQLVAILAAAGLGLLALLVLGIRRFRWPRAAEARDRIDATLPGRPLATLLDTPALGRGDPAAEAVWAAHLARMRRLAASARPVVADLRLAARDPWALRLMALVALVAALVFARDRGVESVATALQAPPGRRHRRRPELRGLGRAAGLHRPPDALPARGPRRRAARGAAGHRRHPARLRRRRPLRPRRVGLRRPAGRARRGRPGHRLGELRGRRQRHGDAVPVRRRPGKLDLHHGARRGPDHRAARQPRAHRDRRDPTRLRGTGRPRHRRRPRRHRPRPRPRRPPLRPRGRARGAAAARRRPAAADDRRRRRPVGDAGRGLLQAPARRPAGDGAPRRRGRHRPAGREPGPRGGAADAPLLRPGGAGADRAAPRPAVVGRQRPPRRPGAARHHQPARGLLRQPARLPRGPHRDPPPRRRREGRRRRRGPRRDRRGALAGRGADRGRRPRQRRRTAGARQGAAAGGAPRATPPTRRSPG